MLYEDKILIPFHLIDGAGILFFSHVFTLAHHVFENFITRKLDFSWEYWFKNENWIVPIKETRAFYSHPLHGGKICTIQLSLSEIKNTSFELSYHFFQENILCCYLRMRHVFCDKKTNQKTEIPLEVRSSLSGKMAQLMPDSS